ncbi:hypothetical protein CPB84DRAFT_1790004 [Gymnopilus junonius]|uniref:Uncharacterized protein n=1 Tax=Gymnopilus junonius TaxID=109634 RepID=A0A9P5NFF5_GYMJU|nr:hypothetical protein CPB84DRAFT_1790004 [Gymnopilus junonius]
MLCLAHSPLVCLLSSSYQKRSAIVAAESRAPLFLQIETFPQINSTCKAQPAPKTETFLKSTHARHNPRWKSDCRAYFQSISVISLSSDSAVAPAVFDALSAVFSTTIAGQKDRFLLQVWIGRMRLLWIFVQFLESLKKAWPRSIARTSCA